MKWQYKVMEYEGADHEHLLQMLRIGPSSLGFEGWEAVSALQWAEKSCTILFKRPIEKPMTEKPRTSKTAIVILALLISFLLSILVAIPAEDALFALCDYTLSAWPIWAIAFVLLKGLDK